jgi:uncharacterized protein YhfF
MGMTNETIDKMWLDYLMVIGENKEITKKTYTSWCFGGTNDEANELIELVLSGEKEATTSLYYWYDIEGESLPTIGDLGIVTDPSDIAKCIIETKNVIVVPFCDVKEEFASKEGEGDKSLEY